jgi:phage tail sheath protein FI
MAKAAIDDIEVLLPVSTSVVGKYADTDNSRGVWKAPANVNLDYVESPEFLVTHKEQESLNVDVEAGKSINVIRSFTGRGAAIIWGARTLAGNDNEWRYIPVRRYFNMVEESVKNATEQFVFEPNDENTWVRVKSMIQNYLTQQWKSGALQGSSIKEAFFIHFCLGETMTNLDLLEGRMIVEIGLAVVRPAEFIILRFMHKMLDES